MEGRLQASVEQFLDYLRTVKDASPHTVRAYETDLADFMAWLATQPALKAKRPALRQIDRIQVRGYLASLHARRLSRQTVARHLSALRSFFRWLGQLLFGEPQSQRPFRPSLSQPGRAVDDSVSSGSSQQRDESRRREPKPVDAGQFTPLTRDQALKKAKGLRWQWGAWFGRRDVVPPVSDPRTELIDRAMVGQGLISPEELAACAR